MKTLNSLSRCIQVFVLLVWALPFSPTAAHASDAQIIEAVQRLHAGTATPADRATLISNNGRLNTMARAGQLAPGNPSLNQSYYNNAQDYFSSANNMAAQRAAERAGVRVQVQPRKPGQVSYNPGTDTDLIVFRGPDGKLVTTQQLNNLDKYHQEGLRKILRSMGQTPPRGRIDANTDFMPHPDHATGDTFVRQSNAINARGGGRVYGSGRCSRGIPVA